MPAGEKYVVLQHVQNAQSVGPLETSVADPDPGSGSWMNILDHISESLETIFWVNDTTLMGIRNLFDPGSGMENSDPG